MHLETNMHGWICACATCGCCVNNYSCNKGLIALVTSTGKVNSTRLRLVQLVALPLLVILVLLIPYCTLNHTINYTNYSWIQFEFTTHKIKNCTLYFTHHWHRTEWRCCYTPDTQSPCSSCQATQLTNEAQERPLYTRPNISDQPLPSIPPRLWRFWGRPPHQTIYSSDRRCSSQEYLFNRMTQLFQGLGTWWGSFGLHCFTIGSLTLGGLIVLSVWRG